MKARKNPALELNQYKKMFFLIGLSISILFVHMLMEWKFKDTLEVVRLDDLRELKVGKFQEIRIPATSQKTPSQLRTVFESPEIKEIANEQGIAKAIEMNLDAEMKEYTLPNYSVYGTGTEFEGMATVPSTRSTLDLPIPEEEKEEEEIFLVVEEKPQFEGGIEGFYQYVAANLVYPKAASEANLGGKVYLEFIVNKDGSIDDIKVIKGIGLGCDEEAIRVLKSSPKWQPGKQRGRPVKVKMAVPIYFKLIKR